MGHEKSPNRGEINVLQQILKLRAGYDMYPKTLAYVFSHQYLSNFVQHFL